MNISPISLTKLVKATPPPGLGYYARRAEVIVSRMTAILSLASLLTTKYGYVCMEDSSGDIWVAHHDDNPFGVFLPPGGRQLFIVADDCDEYHPWYHRMFAIVRTKGRRPLTTTIPYKTAVRNLYAGFEDGITPESIAISRAQPPPGAVNVFTVFRSWLRDDLSIEYKMSNHEFIHLSHMLWARDEHKSMWRRASLQYKAAITRGFKHHLPDFVRLELCMNGLLVSAVKLAEIHGLPIRGKRKPTGHVEDEAACELQEVTQLKKLHSVEADKETYLNQEILRCLPRYLQISNNDATELIELALSRMHVNSGY
ncbi:hypothetical protein RUND412_010625 [Rhizina undulata]